MNTDWKLSTPPESSVRVDTEVLAMRAPLVRVHRDEEGTWSFDGPETPKQAKQTKMQAVIGAWPHVAALDDLDAGGAAVWSWRQHGWASEFECECGSCEQPVAGDIDRKSWPAELQPHTIISVEQTALSGQRPLTDIIRTEGGTAMLGPGDHRRTVDLMTPVAMANVIRRWPHTMQALKMLAEGRGMRWNQEALNWHEYVLA